MDGVTFRLIVNKRRRAYLGSESVFIQFKMLEVSAIREQRGLVEGFSKYQEEFAKDGERSSCFKSSMSKSLD